MINEEAIKFLELEKESIKKGWDFVNHEGREYFEKSLEVCDMAIKALAQQSSFINKPCVSEEVCREDKMQVLEKIRAEIEDLTYYCWEVSPRTVIDDVLEIIDKYKAESEDKG